MNRMNAKAPVDVQDIAKQAGQAQSSTGDRFANLWKQRSEQVQTGTRAAAQGPQSMASLFVPKESAALKQAGKPSQMGQAPQAPQAPEALPEQAAPQAKANFAQRPVPEQRSPVEAESKAFEWQQKLPPRVRQAVEQWKTRRAFNDGFKGPSGY